MTNELATTTTPDIVQVLAAEAKMLPEDYYNAVREMCNCPKATEAQFFGLLMQAKRLGLDPIVRQLYLMETQRGVQVVIPVDGYLTLMRRHPDYLSHTCDIGEDRVGGQFAEATIYTKSQHKAGTPPFKHREYMKECVKTTGPWKSHPLRMLQHKAMSQAVRYAFAVYAPDEDEFARLDDVAAGDGATIRDATPAVPLPALQTDAVDADVAESAPPAPDPLDGLSDEGRKVMERLRTVDTRERFATASAFVNGLIDKHDAGGGTLTDADASALVREIAALEQRFAEMDCGSPAGGLFGEE